MTRQFKVTTGNGVWFDLYHSDEDLNDPTPILADDGSLAEVFASLDEGTPVTDLEQAKVEAKLQFFGHKWTVSNGEVAYTKGDKEVHTVTEDVFGSKKDPLPSNEDQAVYRNFSGDLETVTVSRGNGHDYYGIERSEMAMASLGV